MSIFIVKSGNGYFLEFGVPQMTSDPVKATRMPFSRAENVSVELGRLGFQSELVEVILARFRSKEKQEDFTDESDIVTHKNRTNCS